MSNKKSLDDYIFDIKNKISNQDYLAALTIIENAIEDYPGQPSLLINAGNIYKLHGDIKKAEHYFLKSLSMHESKEAHNNLAAIYLDYEDYEKSSSHAQHAVNLDSHYIDAHYNYALSLERMQDYDNAINSVKQILKIDNINSKALVLLFRIYQDTCNWNEIDEIGMKLNSLIGDGEEHPFLNISRSDDERLNYKVALSWKEKHVSQKIILKEQNINIKKSKIKVGYICGEFRNHPTYHLTKNLFKNHNREKFEIFIFSFNHELEIKNELEKNVDEFVDLNEINEFDSINLIHGYDLDILIDLTILITNNHINILKAKPSKKIISYLGFPGTSGHDCYDYIISDKTVTPKESQKYYSENFLYLPRCYQVNNGNHNLDKCNKNKEDYGLPNNGFILSSFNQSFKIDKKMFNCWLEILQELPESIIWLLEDNKTAQLNLLKYAKKRNIDSDRIIFAKRVSRSEHMERLKLADIALDTRIYNGHTTTTDALQSGVPVVTVTGNHFASRVSTSLLNTFNLNELACKNLAEYKEKVKKICLDEKYKKNLVCKLSSGSAFNDFYDNKKFINELEKILIQIS